MKKYIALLTLTGALYLRASTQTSYIDSLKTFIIDYVDKHEVVKGDDKKQMHFFDIDKKYRVTAQFEKKDNGQWFQMSTSGKMKQIYRVYGVIRFKIGDTALNLNIYQSQNLMQSDQYKNYLFLPFTDATTGKETYDSGRYIDLSSSDIQNNQVVIDFNKAYNPYCAYVTGVYNCPIPPRENNLSVAIKAGEKKYGKH